MNSVAALLHSANSAHKEGNHFLAEDLYKQVIENSPDNLEALQRLALVYISSDQPRAAIPLLQKAIAINANNANVAYNLALAFQKAEELESAIHFYKVALNIKPDFSLAYNNLGVAYQYKGDLDLANDYFEKAFSFAPECIDAYYNYTQSHKFTENDNPLIERITKLLNSSKLSENDKIKLNFTLGKINDDLKIYDRAFNYYKAGNELKNPDFNTTHFKHYIDQIIENYSPSLFRKLSKFQSSSNRRFIFVLGMPRSGTTLVEQIIASHYSVKSAGESGFVGDIVDELSTLINSSKNYPACIQDLSGEKLLLISTNLNSQIDSLPYSGDIITDKSPINFLHIGLMMLLFPNSLIVQTNRNPIDTCLSCYFQNFDRQHQYSYDLNNLVFFYKQYSRLMQHWKTLLSDRIIDISYESLVTNQLDETRRLIHACDIPWDENCLRFYDSSSIVSSASKWQIRQPVYKTSVNKWKNYEKYISELVNNLNTH